MYVLYFYKVLICSRSISISTNSFSFSSVRFRQCGRMMQLRVASIFQQHAWPVQRFGARRRMVERSAFVYTQIMYTCFAYTAYRAVDITHRDGFNGTAVKRKCSFDAPRSAFCSQAWFALKTVHILRISYVEQIRNSRARTYIGTHARKVWRENYISSRGIRYEFKKKRGKWGNGDFRVYYTDLKT